MVRMNTTMTFKIDKEIKAQAQETAKRLGLPLSTIINAYLKELVATGHVEFTATEQMTPQMERIIEGFQKEIARGDTVGPFGTAEEAIEYLDSPESKNIADER